jgi:hypothetical protein
MMAIQQIAPPKPVDPGVEAELDRLPTTPIAELRKRYREVFRTEPPKRSVRICCGGALRIGFRRRPMAAYPLRRDAYSINW